MAYYVDTLSENAFGNYEDLLKDISYSPAMGLWRHLYTQMRRATRIQAACRTKIMRGKSCSYSPLA